MNPEQQAFVIINALQGLQQAAPRRPVMFAELVHFTFASAAVDEAHIQGCLGTDLNLRRRFNALLRQRRLTGAPREARAQHSAAIEQRQGEGFVLKFRTSKAVSTQIYLILELQRELAIDTQKELILIGSVNDAVMRLVFPAPEDFKTQHILLDSDPKLDILRHGECEISLLQA